MKKIIFILIAAIFLLILNSSMVFAHCPICTAAVGAAAVSAKYYGLDISLIGLLIGAFGISTGLWIGLKIKKYSRFQLSLIILASFLLTVIPLLYLNNESIYLPLLFFGEAGTLLNKVYWINSLLFGAIIGGITTLIAYWLHIYIKKAKGKVLFPFQGVAITLLFLVISGLSLYFTVR